MTRAKTVGMNVDGGLGGVAAAARSRLGEISETRSVRTRHVGALVAFAPGAQWSTGSLRVPFEHKDTAAWMAEASASADAELLDLAGDAALVVVRNAQSALGQYGFRGDRWVFGQGFDAALGISRGAVHAAGKFSRRGLTVACPNTPLMLTLTAVLVRLGITATPTGGQPRVMVRAGDVPAALDRLGLAGVGEQYQGVLGSPARKGK